MRFTAKKQRAKTKTKTANRPTILLICGGRGNDMQVIGFAFLFPFSRCPVAQDNQAKNRSSTKNALRKSR